MYNFYSLWRKPWLLFGLFCGLLFTANTLASPPSSGWLTSAEAPHLSVKLTLTGQYDATSRVLPATLQVQLADDWKTYWQARGKEGLRRRYSGLNRKVLRTWIGSGLHRIDIWYKVLQPRVIKKT